MTTEPGAANASTDRMASSAHAIDGPRMLAVARERSVLPSRWKLVLFAFALSTVLGAAVFVHSKGAEQKALLRMPAADRAALYEETLRSAQSLCARAQTDEDLLDRCIGASEFLRRFPECDAACQELVRAHRRGPTR